MSRTKKVVMEVQGTSVSVLSIQGGDYISLTDMLKAKDGEFFISDWLRNRNTVEFLGIWERVHNPAFNYGEFAIIKSQAGLNSYKISVKDWVIKTKAIGLRATAGRYGGTYAHKDIAFEFGMWISPEFKVYLIKEFQRLKEDESRRLSLAWNLNRTLSKLTMAKPENGSGFNGLLDDPNHLAPNLNTYINGFSPNVRAIMEGFKFGEQIAYMAEKDLLYLVIKAFADPKIDLSPERVDPMQMGYVFEELIRIGAEQSNEEAGEHFTPTSRRARWKSSRPISSASKTTS